MNTISLVEWVAAMQFGNELLWLIMLVVNFVVILLAYRFFGRIGLYAWVPIAVIIANIQVVKMILM